MMIVTWEYAKPEQTPIVAYLCYDSSLAVFKTYRKVDTVKLPLFEFTGITVEMDVADELVVIDGRQEYKMRLPYTMAAIANRIANGRDCPEWLIDTFNNTCYDSPNRL